jgi:hypothetical protein
MSIILPQKPLDFHALQIPNNLVIYAITTMLSVNVTLLKGVPKANGHKQQDHISPKIEQRLILQNHPMKGILTAEDAGMNCRK